MDDQTTLPIGDAGSSHDDFKTRLVNRKVDREACVAVLQGVRLPHALGSPLMQYCVIRGMRYHDGFGEEIQLATPAFSRVWNTRRIMSNTIPDITDPEHIPYCIWHPKVASETTYRGLFQRYPEMKYQVARACAVAGYTDLYHELDFLPEVNVAEEARDNGHLDIFNEIMAAPVRYSIMNDYDRTVNLDAPRAGACLNGDTAVRSTLDKKRKIEPPIVINPFPDLDCSGSDDSEDDLFVQERVEPGYFNITEDCHVDLYDGYSEYPEQQARPSRPDLISPLLYSPLPTDLPHGNKDVLILMAAYHGDIDRYARLRRPKPVQRQFSCIMRGIYHNTLFARYWADRMDALHARQIPDDDFHTHLDGLHSHRLISKAITARYIMNNNLCRIPTTTQLHRIDLPYAIWYPSTPDKETLRELVRRQPEATPQAARACIVGEYYDLFEELDLTPDEGLIVEAKSKRLGLECFKEWLEKKIEKLGPEFRPTSYWMGQGWKNTPGNQLTEPMFQAEFLHSRIDEELVYVPILYNGYDRAVYEGYNVDTSKLELAVSAVGSGMLKDGEERIDVLRLYEKMGGREGWDD